MDVAEEYVDPNELFEDIVSEIKRETISLASDALTSTVDNGQEYQGERDDWVDVLVPYTSLQKHMSHKGSIAEVDVSREEIREKVLEMYGQSKIEAFPLKLRSDEAPAMNEPELPAPPEPLGGGKLFMPSRPRRERSHANQPFRCLECFVGFTRADNLKRHYKLLHEGGETFECPHCYRGFARKNTLNRHITSQHTREKKYKCIYCDKSFIYSFEVDPHVQNCHTDEKGYPCPLCEMKFKCARSLERHTLSIHEGTKYKCTECDTYLSSLDAYKRHGARFHPASALAHRRFISSSKEKPVWTCSLCQASFSIYNNLVRHIEKIHRKPPTNGENYACELCDNKFLTHETYARHMAKFHGSAAVVEEDGQQPGGGGGGAEGAEDEVGRVEMGEISLTEFIAQGTIPGAEAFPPSDATFP